MGEDMFPFENEAYYFRHKVSTLLAMMAVDTTDPSRSLFAVTETLDGELRLPSERLKRGGNTFEDAKKIFCRLTLSDPSYVSLTQVGAIDGIEDDAIAVLYTVAMPFRVPLMDASTRWLDFSQVSSNPQLKALFGYACKYHKVGIT